MSKLHNYVNYYGHHFSNYTFKVEYAQGWATLLQFNFVKFYKPQHVPKAAPTTLPLFLTSINYSAPLWRRSLSPWIDLYQHRVMSITLEKGKYFKTIQHSTIHIHIVYTQTQRNKEAM